MAELFLFVGAIQLRDRLYDLLEVLARWWLLLSHARKFRVWIGKRK